ncbi:MAG: DUF3253 domain-containing protein [Pseudomonadota bacterium]
MNIRDAILVAVQERGEGKTICPSEVARTLDRVRWRALMPQVREEASALLADSQIAVTQKGRPVDPLEAKGPIRFGLPGRPNQPN